MHRPHQLVGYSRPCGIQHGNQLAFTERCPAQTRWRVRRDGSAGDEIILLLLDIDMPVMDGLDLLPKIKGRKPRLPVLVISVYGDADTVTRARERGADQFLTKPVDFAKLRRDIMAVTADAMRRDA